MNNFPVVPAPRIPNPNVVVITLRPGKFIENKRYPEEMPIRAFLLLLFCVNFSRANCLIVKKMI